MFSTTSHRIARRFQMLCQIHFVLCDSCFLLIKRWKIIYIMALRLSQYIGDDEDDARFNLRIERKRLRDHSNPFDMYEKEFIDIYRMPQELAFLLRDLIVPHMATKEISKEIRLLAALSFLSEGSFQKKVGVNYLTCVSQSIVCRGITEICTIINSHMMPNYIRFPQTRNEMNSIKLQFYEKFNWPGIIGCVDCTHVSMFRPNKRVEHVYLNRHHYHSKNVQLICDYNLKILNINAKYGGSNHDATIWRKSLAKAFLHNKYDAGELQNTWLLGDSGYPLQPWLMVPIEHPANESEERYNMAHRSARNCIERCNGVLKSRFRCLSKDRCLKYSPEMMGLIINTCATLHNFLKIHNYSDDHDLVQGDENEIDNFEGEEEYLQDSSAIRLLEIGREVRTTIVQNYFRM